MEEKLELKELKVSVDQIDNAVNWVEKNKNEIEQDFLTIENCFDRIAAAEKRLDENEETIEQDSIVLDNCFDRIAAAEVRLDKLESAEIEVDSDFSDTSENPVQNKVITEQFSHYYTTAETDEKITEKVSEIVAGAPDDFNTLKEMSDWLTEHEDSAATMNSAIQKNASDISTANTNITKNAADISTANSAIQKNKTDIETANTNIRAIKNDVLINQSAIGLKKKNLLNNTAKSTITNGITFTVNDDKTITASGTATATTAFEIGPIANVTGNCILSGCPSGGTFETYALAVYSSGGTLTNIVDYGNKKTGDFTNQLGTVKIRIATGTTVDNLVFAPMLRYADITDDTYEPYVPSINEQISPTVKSVTELYNSCGVKNKIKIKSGVVKYGDFTLTANSDGTVKVSPGTTTTLINMTASESWKTLTKITIPAGNYYFESNAESGVSSDIRKADGTVICSNKNTCTITEETELYLNIRINANTTVSEEVILKPLFMLSYIKDKTYVPYIPTNTDLQEQINTLLARIEALETATTEGGE